MRPKRCVFPNQIPEWSTSCLKGPASPRAATLEYIAVAIINSADSRCSGGALLSKPTVYEWARRNTVEYIESLVLAIDWHIFVTGPWLP